MLELRKLKDAAIAASKASVEDDNLGIFIKLRAYGFLVQGQREGEDGEMRHTSRTLYFETLELSNANPLLQAVQDVIRELEDRKE